MDNQEVTLSELFWCMTTIVVIAIVAAWGIDALWGADCCDDPGGAFFVNGERWHLCTFDGVVELPDEVPDDALIERNDEIVPPFFMMLMGFWWF